MVENTGEEEDRVDVKSSSNPLSKKISKILNTRLEDDKDLLDAMKELSTFFSENSLRTRRNLRGDIEKRSLTINQDFVLALGEVKTVLDTVYEGVLKMNDICNDMSSRLASAKQCTKSLINETSSLKKQSDRLKIEQQISRAFVKNFQLSSNEMSLLQGKQNKGDPVTQDFFPALDKVYQIHRNSQILLQHGHQVAALDIMEQMALYQETGLERLYRWAQSQCRMLGGHDVPLLLIRTMSYLEARPVLFQYVLDEYTSSQRADLTRNFLDAMTKGGSSRPIELHAHDPPRYIGDMLAWLHQAVPNQKENIQNLFSMCRVEDKDSRVSTILSSVTEGVIRPLTTRVEQVVLSEPGAITLYRLTNLITFYTMVLEQISGPSPLITCLQELHELTHRTFKSALQSQVNRLTEKIVAPVSGGDLNPSPALNQAVDLLKELLMAGDVVDAEKDGVTNILSTVVDPILMGLNESATLLGTVDMSVYLLNCLHQLKVALADFDQCDMRQEMIQGQIDAQLDTLISEQSSSIVHSLFLSGIYTTLQNPSPEPLSLQPHMDQISIKAFLTRLQNFLTSPEGLYLPQIQFLMSNQQRQIVKKKCHGVILSIYRQLYEAVHNPLNKYPDPAQLMPRSPDQIMSLL